MSRTLQAFLPLAVLLAAFLVSQSVYTVTETDQVIITRLGQYIRTVREPGLHARVPFFERVNRCEKRILAEDAEPGEYLTLDKKRLVVDHVTRWRIVDPLLFFKTVRDETGARARLDDIVFSEMRREISAREFGEVISNKRESVMEAIAKNTAGQTAQFGIEVLDVRIKRADLPREVQASVFARMVAERERIAKRYRSEGEEESAKIRGQTDKEKTIVVAKAYEESLKLRGEGDAEAARIYAEAFNQDPEFYRFVRSLEAYPAILRERDTMVMSSQSDLFRYFARPSASAEVRP